MNDSSSNMARFDKQTINNTTCRARAATWSVLCRSVGHLTPAPAASSPEPEVGLFVLPLLDQLQRHRFNFAHQSCRYQHRHRLPQWMIPTISIIIIMIIIMRPLFTCRRMMPKPRTIFSPRDRCSRRGQRGRTVAPGEVEL